MRFSGRMVVIVMLLIAAIVLITSGTMAFYSQSFSLTALLHTAEFELRVNESTSAAQTLSDMTIAPGQTLTRSIKIDTSGLKTQARLQVTLAVSASGILPSGLSVSLDGDAATGTNSLSVTKTIDNAQEKVYPMTVSVTWNVSNGENLEQYRNLDITYNVTVSAEQTGGAL